MHLVERRHIGVAGELADLAGDFELGNAAHQLFARLAVGDQIGDRDALQRVLLGKARDLRAAHHRAVVIDQFADRRHRLDPGEPAEIDRRLGMARAHQHPAILGDQREDVPRPDKIGAAGIAVRQVADRRGAVLGGNAGGGAVAIVDRNGKGGAVDRVIVGDHRRQVQAARDLAGQRRADDAAGVAHDERHFLGRGMDRGDDQVALVLTVVVIGDDDDLAGGERLDRFADTGLRHVDPLRGHRPARQSRWRREISGSPSAARRWSAATG